MGTDGTDGGATFRALHGKAFIIPNPWDIGTAKMLAAAGFAALATTSAGYAFSRGRPDGAVPFEERIAHAREIAAATSLPVSADLENGMGEPRRQRAVAGERRPEHRPLRRRRGARR